ncbi:Citrate synthase [Thermovirga lienii DSM 17291]|uniref:citrate synthase (unknown stereospecificity) n=1 Tax=Thermovirga lienii (strain ATCC BAA-1197 / DSM 17291 / Cas60314) TaxID=580340 RepID=G7V6N1_THELD|nr:citrate/2-methylcitrate synthase [Thermovirga lienii]AER65990.1 Citrate synthase [Thermovirga lienii DSM 17291]
MVVRSSEPTYVAPNRLVLDGEDITSWIERASPAELWFRMIQGRAPQPVEVRVFNAILCAMADHGSTPPSTQAARLVASTGSGVHCALAAGMMAFGEHHAGAIEKAMGFFEEINQSGRKPSEVVMEILAERRKIPGFGHRYHTKDPRVEPLVRLGKNLPNTTFLEMFLEMERALRNLKGINGNIDGVSGALLLDMGFVKEAGRAVFFAGRLPGMVSWIIKEIYSGYFKPYKLCLDAKGA